MKRKKKSILSLLLLLVMVCTYAVAPNQFTAYAAEDELVDQTEQSIEEVVLFEGSGTSFEWGQAVKIGRAHV